MAAYKQRERVAKDTIAARIRHGALLQMSDYRVVRSPALFTSLTRETLPPARTIYRLLACGFAADVPEKIESTTHPALLSDRCFFVTDRIAHARSRVAARHARCCPRGAEGIGHSFQEIPRQAKQSAILSEDPDEQMPPRKSKLPALTKDEQELFRKWSSRSRVSAALGFRALPRRSNRLRTGAEAAWIKNPIDRFVLDA
jgi:hypothetical protein